nr:hypothetical protein CFP56_00913 [Quercus suber]
MRQDVVPSWSCMSIADLQRSLVQLSLTIPSVTSIMDFCIDLYLSPALSMALLRLAFTRSLMAASHTARPRPKKAGLDL